MRLIILLCVFIFNLHATGIQGKVAPSLGVDKWIQTNGKSSIKIEDYRGKVLYIYGFQSWCPGCHAHGFPTLGTLSKHYKNDKDVEFLAIQTAFEGHFVNTVGAAELIVKKYDLTMPVGHSGFDYKASEFMANYKSGGTPWTVIVDKKGIVRFNNFHAKADDIIEFIDALKVEN